MIIGISESKTLTKHIACECKVKFEFDGRKCNSNKKWNNNNCRCECKKHVFKKSIWNPATCICENGK